MAAFPHTDRFATPFTGPKFILYKYSPERFRWQHFQLQGGTPDL